MACCCCCCCCCAIGTALGEEERLEGPRVRKEGDRDTGERRCEFECECLWVCLRLSTGLIMCPIPLMLSGELILESPFGSTLGLLTAL
jgi:hypothetical protein